MADPKKIIPIDQLPEATILSDSDETILVQNGSATKKADLGLIGGYLATEQTHSELNTTNKQLVGAINEVKGVELIGVIKAYESTVVLYDDHIKTSSKVRCFWETYGMSAKDVKVTPGQVLVKINPQEEDVKVLVQIT